MGATEPMDRIPADEDPCAALLGRLEALVHGTPPPVELEATLHDARGLMTTLGRERDLCERTLSSMAEGEASSISSIAATLLHIRVLTAKIEFIDDTLASVPDRVP